MLKRSSLSVLLLLAPSGLLAQARLDGTWLLTTDVFGYPLHQRLTLAQKGESLSGKAGSDEVEGTLKGRRGPIRLEAGGRRPQRVLRHVVGRQDLRDGRPRRRRHRRARREHVHRDSRRRRGAPGRRSGTSSRRPSFHRHFSAETKPVLTISPGDTVHTTTVDAGGTDEKGVTRVLGGNPQTGPFYVETAMPGDVLAIHIDRLRLNRDWAVSDDAIVSRAARQRPGGEDEGRRARRFAGVSTASKGVATPDKPPSTSRRYSVPAAADARLRRRRARLRRRGARARATPDATAATWTSTSIVEGATVYLQVRQPGALLYIGDGHAVQGDGELNGNALETSMDVEFTVDLVPEKRIADAAGRVADAHHGGGPRRLARGRAAASATSGMAQWLEQDYGLTPSEVAQVLGTSSEIVVNEVADRNAGSCRLAKDRLQGIPRKPAEKAQ